MAKGRNPDSNYRVLVDICLAYCLTLKRTDRSSIQSNVRMASHDSNATNTADAKATELVADRLTLMGICFRWRCPYRLSPLI